MMQEKKLKNKTNTNDRGFMRVIEYYNSFDRQDAIYDINLEALTHLDYAFLLPASDGSVYFKDEDNHSSIERAKH